MSETLVAVLSNVEKTQNEIIACMITQICENVENCSVVDFYKDYKLSKTTYGEYFMVKAEQWLYNGWFDIYKNYRELVKPYDNIILIKTPTLRGLYPRQLDKKFLKEIDRGFTKDNEYQMSQDLMKRLIERLVFVKACRDKNVIQFCIDTQEVDFSDVWKFKSYERRYIANHGDMKYFPMYEWAMANTFIQDIDKAQDLYFIGSAFNSEKQELISRYHDNLYQYFGRRRVGFVRANPQTGYFDYYNNDENRREIKVNQSKYLYELKLSKYTVVNPPYDTSCFNMMRFMEAVICDCVPIVLPENNFDDLILTFQDIYDKINFRDLILEKRDCRKLPIEHYLHVRITEWERDKDCIEDIKSCKSYQKIVDQEYVQSEFAKLLKG
ncbi:MAG: hypothetical protein IJV29_02230 [Butyrivibrio sp.]|nr:hypothetical protein [Butyrivibrio sp.]